jgi:hypothetical protein
MFKKLFSMLRSRREVIPAPPVPPIDPNELASLCYLDDSLPHLDWDAVDAWVAERTELAQPPVLRRAVVHAFHQLLMQYVQPPHTIWRSGHAEGFAPSGMVRPISEVTERAWNLIESTITPLVTPGSATSVAVIAFSSRDLYHAYTLSRFPEEGSWSTSGGMYVREEPPRIAQIVLPLEVRQSVENIISHELTHHMLTGLKLPLWVEEGLTQMMEERVTGWSPLQANSETVMRQRELWKDGRIERFWTGESFFSDYEDEQKQSYNLAQLLVRGFLANRPDDFFRFARACKVEPPEIAIKTHLGITLEELGDRVIT